MGGRRGDRNSRPIGCEPRGVRGGGGVKPKRFHAKKGGEVFGRNRTLGGTHGT